MKISPSLIKNLLFFTPCAVDPNWPIVGVCLGFPSEVPLCAFCEIFPSAIAFVRGLLDAGQNVRGLHKKLASRCKAKPVWKALGDKTKEGC